MKENWGDTASDYSWPIVPVPGQLANDCNQPEAAIGRDGFAATTVNVTLIGTVAGSRPG